MKYLSLFIILFINFYAYLISPLLGARCRFQPTCSSYAKEALIEHGPVIGIFLFVKRILKCHPFTSSKYDPVPKRKINEIK